MYKLGIAGFRHSHIFSLYNRAKENKEISDILACEENSEAKNIAEWECGIKFTHGCYEDLLKDTSVNIIAIGNYYGIRGEMAISALKAGKHVIADKPLCTSIEELREIERLSGKNKLSVGLMLDMRENPNVLSAKKIIDAGIIGEIHNIQFGGQHPLNYGIRPKWYFEKGKHGGVINDIAVHGIDLIKFLTRLEIKSIIGARTWNAYATKEKHFKDSGQFMLELNNGAGVIADVSYSVPNTIGFSLPYYWEFKIWGNKGMLCFSDNSDGVQLYENGYKEVQNIPGIRSDKNFLDVFLNEIKGQEKANTKSVLKVTESTLLIQKYADNCSC